jgi:BirA family biotin operon repressor/biotin-[acetyl-CoA-carboxylase] ligase
LLADPDAQEGDWLVAKTQDSGRGRQGRSWKSATGNFFGSTVIALKPGDPAPTTLSLTAGLALIDAVAAAVPGKALMLKWPNDLLLADAKLAGILLERSGEWIVAGFGVNLGAAPALADRRAASLGGAITPEEFAPSLATAFARRLGQWRSGDADGLRDDWLGRAHPVGTPLSVHGAGAARIAGNFAGLEHDGALRLQTDHGIEIIRAGDVEL